MSYSREHRKMKPVLDLAKKLDIATNPAPEAIYSSASAGFQIWATLEDKPRGWEGIQMTQGAFTKPCAHIASIIWIWGGTEDDPIIEYLGISTDAWDHTKRRKENIDLHNNQDDLLWACRKAEQLFKQAGVQMPDFKILE